MRAYEFIAEKFARQNEVSGILNNPDILMGFECEGVAFNRAYQNIIDSLEDDPDFDHFHPGDPDFQVIIANTIEEMEGFNTRSNIARKISQKLQVNCTVYTNSIDGHSRNFMDYSKWGIVMDASVKGEGIPLEIVSSVYNIGAGLKKLEQLFQFMSEENISTNETTGLHITMSIKNKSERDYDFFKMAMFYDEKGVAKLFDRQNNEFSQMIKNKLKGYIGKEGINFSELIKDQRDFYKISQILKAEGDWFRSAFYKEKYYSIRPKSNGLFEFRMLGGTDYELRFPQIRKQIIDMANIMLIGSDDNLYREEYVKKVVNLIDQDKFSNKKKTLVDEIRDMVKMLPLKDILAGRISLDDKNNIRKIYYLILKNKLKNAFTKNDFFDNFINNKIISTPLQDDPTHSNKPS